MVVDVLIVIIIGLCVYIKERNKSVREEREQSIKYQQDRYEEEQRKRP